MALILPFHDLLKRLSDFGVEFVVVGGVAATLHGSARITTDLDVCAPLGEPNLSKILAALKDIQPRLRMRPDRMPLPYDPARLQGLNNLYLETDLGQLDFLGEITGIGSFSEALEHTVPVDLGGVICRVLDLESLIIAKKAAGRRKDLEAVIELEVIQQRRPNPPAGP
jgi:predicted nucleotidyltransferase